MLKCKYKKLINCKIKEKKFYNQFLDYIFNYNKKNSNN